MGTLFSQTLEEAVIRDGQLPLFVVDAIFVRITSKQLLVAKWHEEYKHIWWETDSVLFPQIPLNCLKLIV